MPMMIEALEKKIALYAADVARIDPQTMQDIRVELDGHRIAGLDSVGEALRGLVKSAKDEVRAGQRRIERIVGHFGGLEFGILAARGEEVPSLYLSCRCLYNAESYQTGSALVAALLAVLESVPKHHAGALAQLDMRRKRMEDLRLELARPFEQENRLIDLLARQRDLLKQLNLDKDEAGSATLDAEEARQAG